METITRSVEWGHWGLTFVSWVGELHQRPYLVDIHGQIYFPVGSCGPIDGCLGSPQRAALLAKVKDWQENGVLPEALNREHTTV